MRAPIGGEPAVLRERDDESEKVLFHGWLSEKKREDYASLLQSSYPYRLVQKSLIG